MQLKKKLLFKKLEDYRITVVAPLDNYKLWPRCCWFTNSRMMMLLDLFIYSVNEMAAAMNEGNQAYVMQNSEEVVGVYFQLRIKIL